MKTMQTVLVAMAWALVGCGVAEGEAPEAVVDVAPAPAPEENNPLEAFVDTWRLVQIEVASDFDGQRAVERPDDEAGTLEIDEGLDLAMDVDFTTDVSAFNLALDGPAVAEVDGHLRFDIEGTVEAVDAFEQVQVIPFAGVAECAIDVQDDRVLVCAGDFVGLVEAENPDNGGLVERIEVGLEMVAQFVRE